MLDIVDSHENVVVYPPNKTLERVIEFSKLPVIYDQLLFIDFNSKGEAILGSSSLDSTLWEGTTFFFNNETSLQSLKFYKSCIGSTASDGKFLSDNTVVLAEDTGIINVLSISEEQQQLNSVNYFRHSERIPKLSVWKNTDKVVSCSGNSVSIWNVNSTARKPLVDYENYHTEVINYVDAIQNESNVFASASTDRRCILWDDRLENPATVLYVNEFCALTSVSCNQLDSNYLAVATEGGDIYLLDKREPKEFIATANCNSIIHRVQFGSFNKIAVCGDDNKVTVFQSEEQILEKIYCDDNHKGIVRGLAWSNENLYSCGFDKQVLKHSFH